MEGTTSVSAPVQAAIIDPLPIPHAIARARGSKTSMLANSDARMAKMKVPKSVPIT